MKEEAVTLRKTVVLLLVLAIAIGLLAPAVAAQNNRTNATNVATMLEYEEDAAPTGWLDAVGGIALVVAVIALVLLMVPIRGLMPKELRFFVGIIGVLALALFLVSTLVVFVPVNYVAVVRMTFPTAGRYAIGPGMNLVNPIGTQVTYYTTAVRTMKVNEIAADTASVGRPEIFPSVYVWFRVPMAESGGVDTDKLLALDWLYGPTYEEVFVSEYIISSVKEVSGQHEYDYFGKDRSKAANEIQQVLESKLDGYVMVRDMTISTFRYNAEFEAFLKDLAQRQVELEKETKNVVIEEQKRLQAVKQAEARKAQGEGERDYKIAVAQGEAATLDEASKRLGGDPDAILHYLWLQKWNGQLPATLAGADTNVLLPLQ
jgi:regulator of protease activity HflC (stomatin/prohibitin superfamily)